MKRDDHRARAMHTARRNGMGVPVATARRDWYTIRAQTPSAPAEVLIYDEIGWYGVTATDFVKDLESLDGDEIVVRINSPGGDVYDGIAILNALRGHKATIT
ncbi:ATP-dependent Clp protease proteolytic subunit, partial [Rhodococcus jostii]